MECYLENCETKSSVAEDVRCIQHYANMMQAHMQKIIEHSLAVEKRLEKEMERAGRFKQRLMTEQEKNKQLNLQLKASNKHHKSLRKANSLFDEQGTKNIFKHRHEPGKLFGKENSSKKTVRESKSAETITTAHKSPDKLFKQQKISFAVKPPKQIVEMEENDSTFCETLATSGIEKSVLNTPGIDKAAGPSARSTPQRRPFCLETTDQEQLKEPDVPAIKKEKLSQEDVFVQSDLDIFASDCEVMEADDLPIQLSESNESADSLVQRLMANVDVKKDDELPSPIVKDRKKRKRYYGECRECDEFYDVYAERNGATQTDTFVRDCPKRCKGFLNKKTFLAPIQPRPPMSYRKRDETPKGFWDINPFTDNDATPDL